MTRSGIPAASGESLERILRDLGERTGIVIPDHRRPAVESAIRERLRNGGYSGVEELERRLRTEPAVFDALAGDLTIGETYFYRETWAYRVIRREILPRLQASRTAGIPIRIWSAGCSSGEEPYSLAMLGDDAGLGDGLDVLGTDLARDALARAREAVYGEWSLRGEGRADALRHLEKADGGWRVRERIRRRVRFQYSNLVLDPIPSFASGIFAMDVVLCRNVLVYFDRGSIARVGRKLYDALADGGVLFLAATDPPIHETAPFESVPTPEGTYLRRPAARAALVSVPATPPSPAARVPESARAPEPVPPQAGRPAPPASRPELSPAARARAAFARGDLARVVSLTADLVDDPELAVLHLRALASVASHQARSAAATLVARHPLVTELHYLRAILLLEEAALDDAAAAARRAIYLDRGLAAAHFALGTILERALDAEGARRAYRNARDLCRARAADEPVPLADGERAGRLADVAEAQLALLARAG